MQISTDVSEMSLGTKITIGVGVLALLIVLFFAVNAIFFSKKQETAVRVPPPQGYPDIAPYNTKSWQDMQKKAQTQGANVPMPPPPMGN
jgi:hypothetical protein